MNKVAIYPGTFDPITFGHIDLIKKGLKLFDKIIVAVSDVDNKDYLFENWTSFLAFRRPTFFLSTTLESLVRKPFFLSTGLRVSSYFKSARAIPNFIAPA